MSCVNVPVVQPSKISELDYQLWGQKDFPILQITTSSLGLGYKYQAIRLLFPPRRKSVCGNQSLERQHDSGRVSAESGPVNWARVSQAEGEAVFTTSAAQTTDSWSQNSSSLEPELQGKPKLTHLLTLRKPRPDRPPTPARQKKHTHTHTPVKFRVLVLWGDNSPYLLYMNMHKVSSMLSGGWVMLFAAPHPRQLCDKARSVQ